MYYPEFRFVDIWKMGSKKLWERISVDMIPTYQQQMGNTDIGVTMQRFAKPTFTEGEVSIMPLVFDLDKEENPAAAIEEAKILLNYFFKQWDLNNEQVRVFFSGKKGIHIVIPEEVLGIKPQLNLCILHKKLTMDISSSLELKTTDMSIYRSRGLLRLPNSLHSESNLYKIELYPQELFNQDLVSIRDSAKTPRGPLTHTDPLGLNETAAEEYSKWAKDAVIEKQLKFSYPCLDSLYYNGVTGFRQRHLATLALAIYFRQNLRFLELETFNALIDWNKQNVKFSNEPNFNDIIKEVKAQVRKVYMESYKLGCKDGLVALTLREYCDKTNCKLGNLHDGIYQIERRLQDLPIWGNKRGLGQSTRAVYNAIKDWKDTHDTTLNPIYNDRPSFFLSIYDLANKSQCSSLTANKAIKKLLYVGLIELVPWNVLPKEVRRTKTNRMANYYILPPFTEELEKAICKKTEELIYNPINQKNSTKEILKNSIVNLIEIHNQFTIKMLIEKGFSMRSICTYLLSIIQELNLTEKTKAHNEKYYFVKKTEHEM
ncbi:MAG: hypothetical protein PHX21_07975 [bacterium]|nr:hypothetical protein [bacterium]